MTEVETFRALLAEARHWVVAVQDDSLRERIDAALAEPVATIIDWRSFFLKAERERDEARAEVDGLRKLLDAQSAIIAETRTPAEDRVSALEMDLAETRAEVERLKGEAAAWKEHSEAAERFRKSAVAEVEAKIEEMRATQVDWFREGFDAGKGEKKEWSADSFKRGAHAMREAAAASIDWRIRRGIGINGDTVRDVPVPEDK